MNKLEATIIKTKHFIDLALEIEHGRDSDGNWLEADTEERFPKTNVEKP